MRFDLATDLPKGVTTDAVLAQLGSDGVAVLDAKKRPELEPKIAKAVADSHVPGGNLQIVVIPRDGRHDSQLRDLATAVGKQENSTVLVVSPSWVGSYSKDSSRFELEAAEDYARPLTGDPAASASAFAGRLERPDLPWTAAVLAALIMLAAMLAGLYYVKSRRS